MQAGRLATHQITGLRVAAIALLTLVGATRTVMAQEAPCEALASLRTSLTPGALIAVRDNNGHRFRGVFREVSDASLVLVESSQGLSMPRAIPLAGVAQVKLSDSRTNGFWMGFAAGAAPGIAFGWMVNQYCYNESPSHCPSAMVLFGGLTGLAGAGLGLVLDGAVDGGAVVYSRPTSRATVSVQPWVAAGQRGGGAALSVTF